MRKPVTSEKQIERRLVSGVQKLGGKAYKFVSPGNTGVPDRIVVLPGGLVAFVELKAQDGELTPGQKMQLGRLNRLGALVYVLRSEKCVDWFLDVCRKKLSVRR